MSNDQLTAGVQLVRDPGAREVDGIFQSLEFIVCLGDLELPVLYEKVAFAGGRQHPKGSTHSTAEVKWLAIEGHQVGAELPP